MAVVSDAFGNSNPDDLNSYEAALAMMPQIAGFVPMLTGTGGNCGFPEFDTW